MNLVEWGFYQARRDGAGWRCTLCANIGLTGNGVRPFKPTNPTWYTSHGSRACGFPLVAGLIRAESVRAGRIDHALADRLPPHPRRPLHVARHHRPDAASATRPSSPAASPAAAASSSTQR